EGSPRRGPRAPGGAPEPSDVAGPPPSAPPRTPNERHRPVQTDQPPQAHWLICRMSRDAPPSLPGELHYRRIPCLFQSPGNAPAGAGLRQRTAAGPDRRDLAGMGDGRWRVAGRNRLPHPGGVRLYAEIPVGPAGGPLCAAVAGPPARLDAG